MDKTKIEWCDSTWNPVTGCYHKCPYCYARGIANRFSGHGDKWNDDKIHVLDSKVYAEESEKAEAYPYGFIPTLHRYRLNEYEKKKRTDDFCMQHGRLVWLVGAGRMDRGSVCSLRKSTAAHIFIPNQKPAEIY